MRDHGRVSILIVDDEPMLREVLQEFLAEQGYNITLCPSGNEALKVLRGSDFTVVIADYDLSGVNGIEVLEAYKNQTQQGKSILYSGTGDTEVGKHPSVDIFLTKPFGLPQLMGLLEQLLAE